MSNSNKWFLFEEIDNCHPLLSVDAMIHCVDAYEYGIRKGTVNQTIVRSQKDTDWLCFIGSEFYETAKAFFDKIFLDINWALGISNKIFETSVELRELSASIQKINPTKLTDRELADVLINWSDKRHVAHGYGMAWNYVEFEHGLFSTYMKNYIAKQIAKKKLKFVPNEVFTLLSTPLENTFAKNEEEQLLELAIEAKQSKPISEVFANSSSALEIIKKLEKEQPTFAKQVNKHFQDYCWLSFMYLGPAWPKEYFVDNLNTLMKFSLDQLKEKLREKHSFIDATREKQQAQMNLLEFDEFHRKCVELVQSFLFTKAMRKDAIYYGFYAMQLVFNECAKRLGLSPKQFRMLMSWELRDAVEKHKFDVNELNARAAFWVFHYDGKTKSKTILSGKKAHEFFDALDFEKIQINDTKQLTGECACTGKASGVVKIINLASEISKMQQGDVLVSRATSPNIVPAMKLASAIVTDMGGMTCHAAIVSRELGKPCVIGTKIATKWLHDGDKVSVDATAGIVNLRLRCKVLTK